MNADRVEEAVFGAILDVAGWYELTERKMIPGRDYSEDVARLAETIGHLSTKIAVGRATRKDVSTDEPALQRAQDQLDRIASLEPEPARVKSVRTGKTLRARWEELDVPGRNQFLQSVGVRAVAHKEDMPPIDVQPGPLVADEIPRMAIIMADGLSAVVYLGNLRDILCPRG